MRRMTLWVLAVFALLAVPPHLGAQRVLPPPCGSLTDADTDLEAFGAYFREERFSSVRKTFLRRLGPDDTQAVVKNTGTCQAVLNAALRMLRRHDPTWREVEPNGYDFTVFRYGPYYAIMVRYNYGPNSSQLPAYYPLLIFRARGFEYLTTILT